MQWRAPAFFAFLAALLMLPLAVRAAPFELEMQGKIGKTNDPSHTVYRISEAELLKLPAHTIVTSTRCSRMCCISPKLGAIPLNCARSTTIR
jgi:hypothetical protein